MPRLIRYRVEHARPLPCVRRTDATTGRFGLDCAPMKTQNLWFVRRGEAISGPFPAKLIGRDLMLGRIHAADEASVDQVFWSPVGEVADFKTQVKIKQRIVGPADSPTDWYEERRQAALRWAGDAVAGFARKLALKEKFAEAWQQPKEAQ